MRCWKRYDKKWSVEYYEEIYDAIAGVKLDPVLRMTGKRPIPVKWVDVNKGDAQRSEGRSRLAVAETRPCEALRLLVSFVMSPRNKDEKSHVLMFIDITRAHPHCTM